MDSVVYLLFVTMVTQSALPAFHYHHLQVNAAKVQASTLSESTKPNYHSVWWLYDKFTRFYDLKPLPVTAETLSSFIALVGFSVMSLKSVYNYISALCNLHNLSSFDSSTFDDINVKLTLKALEKLTGHFPLPQLPSQPCHAMT